MKSMEEALDYIEDMAKDFGKKVHHNSEYYIALACVLKIKDFIIYGDRPHSQNEANCMMAKYTGDYVEKTKATLEGKDG